VSRPFRNTGKRRPRKANVLFSGAKQSHRRKRRLQGNDDGRRNKKKIIKHGAGGEIEGSISKGGEGEKGKKMKTLSVRHYPQRKGGRPDSQKDQKGRSK